MNGYETAFDFLIQNEGRQFTQIQNDKGGATKYGITIPFYSDYLDRAATVDDIKALDEPTAKLIYKRLLWDALYCDDLPYPIALALFDTSADKSKAWAIGVAQTIVRVHADGIMGEETIGALKSTDPEMFIYNFVGLLQHSYIEICMHASSQMVFLDGWMKRALRLFLVVNK